MTEALLGSTDRSKWEDKHTKSKWKWLFIVDLSIKNGGSFHSYVNVYQRVSLTKSLPVYFIVAITPAPSESSDLSRSAIDWIASCLKGLKRWASESNPYAVNQHKHQIYLWISFFACSGFTELLFSHSIWGIPAYKYSTQFMFNFMAKKNNVSNNGDGFLSSIFHVTGKQL